jgi:hypothetical protein
MSSMPRSRRSNGKSNGTVRTNGCFVLYVEGPRDQSLLAAWANRMSPRLGSSLDDVTVILGGRQPARAAEHFRTLRATFSTARALCVLDRDADGAPPPPSVAEPGLDFFTWGRRHIESYLLVPGAIRRSLKLPASDARVERFFRAELPATEEGLGALDAKPLFAFRGEFERLLGRAVRPVHVARAMHAGEIHADVIDLLVRVRGGLGLDETRAEPRAPRAE